jgi:uncharacterized protein with PIN domain
MKLLCDHMLGSLAKWLRILGFDTFYPDATFDDDAVLAIAKQQGRVLISRDKQLIQRGKKAHLSVLEIQTSDLREQLKCVLFKMSVNERSILTRCTLCNSPLQSIEKTKVKPYVPEKVYSTRHEFWYCPVCQKYYWMGTHYENMMEKIDALLPHRTT